MQLTFLFLCNCHSTKNPKSVDIARILDSWILITQNMQLTFLCSCHSTKNPASVDIARILDSWILIKNFGFWVLGGLLIGDKTSYY